MFKFLFSGKDGDAAKVEKQRDTVERALTEVNAVLAMMDPKPKVTIDPTTGEISLELPEQMPDEALALPAPSAEGDEELKTAA